MRTMQAGEALTMRMSGIRAQVSRPALALKIHAVETL